MPDLIRSTVTGQGVLHTVSSALSCPPEQIKEYVPQSPVPAGLMKAFLLSVLPFEISEK